MGVSRGALGGLGPAAYPLATGPSLVGAAHGHRGLYIASTAALRHAQRQPSPTTTASGPPPLDFLTGKGASAELDVGGIRTDGLGRSRRKPAGRVLSRQIGRTSADASELRLAAL
jgi:hypothetical protein